MKRAILAAALAAACMPSPATRPAPLTARAALRARVDSLLADPMFRNTNWGVLVVEPATGDTLYSRNAGKLFMPASNQKILTGAVALALLGPDFAYATRFASSAPVVDGVLRGDLAVIGEGDPSMSDAMLGDAMRPLRAAVDSLRARGIREIAGALVKGGNAFPDTTVGFGWEWDDFETPSGAPIDELFFNNGVARVTVFGGERPGDPVRVRTTPARTVPQLAVRAVTTPAAAPGERGPGGSLRWTTDMRGTRPVVQLSGTVRARDSVSALVALRDPAGSWLDAFAEALRDGGVRLHGNVIRSPDMPDPGAPVLVSVTSPPLREILPPFLKPSQNQVGELLLRTLGLARAGVGSADSGRRVIERQLVAWGVDTAGFAVRDGSGLSRHNYLTPETVVRVLDAMRRHAEFRVFYDALPVGGVDGTIATRMRGTPAAGNVRAKTGTVDKARSLSGYVTTADGRQLIFSFLANNFTVANREIERVQDAILVSLAGAQFPTR